MIRAVVDLAALIAEAGEMRTGEERKRDAEVRVEREKEARAERGGHGAALAGREKGEA